MQRSPLTHVSSDDDGVVVVVMAPVMVVMPMMVMMRQHVHDRWREDVMMVMMMPPMMPVVVMVMIVMLHRLQQPGIPFDRCRRQRRSFKPCHAERKAEPKRQRAEPWIESRHDFFPSQRR